LKLYIAHPISGLSGEEVCNYYNNIIDILNPYYELLIPMTAKGFLFKDKSLTAHDYSNPVCKNHAIFERDTWMVSQSDVVLCDLSGNINSTSIGCCMEIGIAAWLHKHVITVIPQNSKYEHAFVLEASDIIYNNIEEAKEYLIKLSKSEL